jgi:RimJ/RimL family protein N-acetyltransferase
MTVFLETPRLLLREFTEDDAESLFALDSDPDVMRFVGPYALDDAEAYRERILSVYRPYYDRNDGYGYRAAMEKAGGAFVGWFILRPALDYRFAAEAGFRLGEAELGYRLRKTAWGKGYATEGARALVHKAFSETDAACVVSTALIGNVASTRVMEKAGLKKVGEFRIPGFDQSAVKYALPKDRWKAE